jgi:hypothetical protein
MIEIPQHPWKPPSNCPPGRLVVKTGSLSTKQGMIPRMLAHMEEVYRHELWPRCGMGLKRWSREFVWSELGHILHYRIIDVEVDHPRRDKQGEVSCGTI